jgi:hypothetical protein
MVKIYIAGRFALKSQIGLLGDQLEKLGYEMSIKWWDIEQKHATVRTHDESFMVGVSEYLGVVNADYVIALIDSADYAYRGTLTELGIAMGKYINKDISKIKKHVFVLTKTDFTNKNCGLLCVPHIALTNVLPIIESDDLLDMVSKIDRLIKEA